MVLASLDPGGLNRERAIICAGDAAAAAGGLLHVEGAGRLALKVLTLLGARGVTS